MDEFFRSMNQAFARNREASASFEWVLLGLLVGIAAFVALGRLRRWRGAALEVDAVARERGLSDGELALMRALARAAAVSPRELLTHPDVFEHATAKALSGSVSLPVSSASLPLVLRRVRQALHFDRLPAHSPLLTTRELSPGTALDHGEHQAQVVEVDETCLRVRFRPPLELTVGATLNLTLRHAREATYELRCVVRQAHSTTAELAHDEAPRRVQLRDYARVEVTAPVTLSALSWPGHALETRQAKGALRDLSAGGAQLVSPTSLPAGVRLALTFTLSGELFSALEGVVLSSSAEGEAALLRVEFTTLTNSARERLAQAVTRLQLERARAKSG